MLSSIGWVIANFSGPTYMEWSNGIIGSAEDASDMRRRMGAAALEMDASDGSGQTRWRDIVAARLPSQHWPQQPVLIARRCELGRERNSFGAGLRRDGTRSVRFQRADERGRG
jgi:hypothetical protein